MKSNELLATRYLKIKSLRKRFGVKQSDAAAIIGCTGSNFAGKENGLYSWRLSECISLRNFFNEKLKQEGEELITLDELFAPTKCQI